MRVSWSEPYLWLHLAGVATVPLWLDICLLGFAAGDPILPVSLEFALVAVFGIAPILWMQWQRPFCIFSLVLFTLKPSALSETRRRLLRFFRTSLNQVIAIAVAVALTVVLWLIYRYAPIASDLTPFQSHWTGLGVAAIAFFAANLFTQVPASVLRVMVVSDAQLSTQSPYPTERIPLDFSLVGIRLQKILPEPASGSWAGPEGQATPAQEPDSSLEPASPADSMAQALVTEPESEAGPSDAMPEPPKGEASDRPQVPDPAPSPPSPDADSAPAD